jgi:hypothetical protein
MLKRTIVLILLMAAGVAIAQTPEDYYKRAAERDQALFNQLQHDGRIAYGQVANYVEFAPRFDAMDTNRDGYVTREELQQYIDVTYLSQVVQTK